MRYLAILLMALVATPAFAGTCSYADRPPPKYDYEPKHAYETVRVSAWTLDILLGKRKTGVTHCGLTLPASNKVYMLDTITTNSVAWNKVLRHEKGHLNGWRH